MTRPHVLVRLRPERSQVAAACRAAADVLRARHAAESADVELVVSELVGDAVRRAAGEVELRIDVDRDRITIEVIAPTVGEAGEPPKLWFASALAFDWGASDSGGGHRTWASLRRTPTPAVD